MIPMHPGENRKSPQKKSAKTRAAIRRAPIPVSAANADDFTKLAARLCNAPAAFVAVMIDGNISFRATRGFRASQDSQLDILCARVIEKDALLQIPDTVAAGIEAAVVTNRKKRRVRFYSGVPFGIAGGTHTGVLGVLGFQPRRLDKTAREMFVLLARQLATAPQRDLDLRKLCDTAAKLKRYSLFNSVRARASQVISTSNDVLTMLQAICDVAVQHGDIRIAFVSRPDSSGVFRFIAQAGAIEYLQQLELHTDPNHLLGNSPVPIVWRTGKPFFAGSFRRTRELLRWRDLAHRHGFKSSATVPILRGGEVWATLTAHLGNEHRFDAESQAVLTELSLNVARGMDRIDSDRREHEHIELQRTLLDNTLAGILIKRQRRVVTSNRRFAELLGIPGAEQLTGLSARLIYPDEAEYERIEKLYPQLLLDGKVRAMDVRIKRADGGSVICDVAAGLVGEPNDGTSVWTFIDVTDRVRLQDRLRHEALHDALTNLPNRRALNDYLPRAIARARRNNTVGAVCIIDLDGFKAVNDTHGHKAGDRLLVNFARRMNRLMRQGDTIVRLGGDEFLLIFEGLAADRLESQLSALMDRLHKAVEEAFSLGRNTSAFVGISGGICCYPCEEIDLDSIFRKADSALYEMKALKTARMTWWKVDGHSLRNVGHKGVATRGMLKQTG